MASANKTPILGSLFLRRPEPGDRLILSNSEPLYVSPKIHDPPDDLLVPHWARGLAVDASHEFSGRSYEAMLQHLLFSQRPSLITSAEIGPGLQLEPVADGEVKIHAPQPVQVLTPDGWISNINA